MRSLVKYIRKKFEWEKYIRHVYMYILFNSQIQTMADLPEQESWRNDRGHMLSKDCAHLSTNRNIIV